MTGAGGRAGQQTLQHRGDAVLRVGGGHLVGGRQHGRVGVGHGHYASFLRTVTSPSDPVRSSELDRLLLRPAHPLLLLVTRRLEVSAAGDLLPAGAVFWAAQEALDIPRDPAPASS